MAILNSEFEGGSTPNKVRRMDIAKKVNMTEKAVKIWFQNKRQSLRRLKSAEREITELPPTPEPSAAVSAINTDAAPTPLVESTPIKPGLVKSHSQEFVSPAANRSSPFRSYSTSNLNMKPSLDKKHSKITLLHRMLAADDEKPKESANNNNKKLVLNLTNKKQPDFVRSAPQASNQVMTFKLAPSVKSEAARKPLGELNPNVLAAPVAKTANDSQCAQGLLSLKTGNY